MHTCRGGSSGAWSRGTRSSSSTSSWCTSCRRSSRRSRSPSTRWPDAYEEAGHGGHFLGATHTLERFRTCFYRPLLSSTENYERWMRNGGKDATDRAREIHLEKLEQYQPPSLDDEVRAELEEYVVRPAGRARRLSEAPTGSGQAKDRPVVGQADPGTLRRVRRQARAWSSCRRHTTHHEAPRRRGEPGPRGRGARGRSGRPARSGSVEKEYCVFATHTDSWRYPSRSTRQQPPPRLGVPRHQPGAVQPGRHRLDLRSERRGRRRR